MVYPKDTDPISNSLSPAAAAAAAAAMEDTNYSRTTRQRRRQQSQENTNRHDELPPNSISPLDLKNVSMLLLGVVVTVGGLFVTVLFLMGSSSSTPVPEVSLTSPSTGVVLTNGSAEGRVFSLSAAVSSITSSFTVFESRPSIPIKEPSRTQTANWNRKRAMIQAGVSAGADMKHEALTLDEQKLYLQKNAANCHKNATAVLSKFDALRNGNHPLSHMASELWKYCAMAVHLRFAEDGHVVAHLHDESILIQSLPDAFPHANVAILGDSESMRIPDNRWIHAAALVMASGATSSNVPHQMVAAMVDDFSLEDLAFDALALPRFLYQLILQDGNANIHGHGELALHPGTNSNGWVLYQMKCFPSVKDTTSDVWESPSPAIFEENRRLTHRCPVEAGDCCDVVNPNSNTVVMTTRYPLLPYQVLPPLEALPQPIGSQHSDNNDKELMMVPFLSTIHENIPPKIPKIKAGSFYDTLKAADCLPSSDNCSKCLRKKDGASCKTCNDVCSCYCKLLCKSSSEKIRRPTSKILTVSKPRYTKDPSRLIPRIIHQTWFESVSREKYPNMSRLMESWKRSGWTYQFYTDDDAAKFLSHHFPPEVREAFDAVLPGAFKADLFRYCVLLIHGGVYADMDVLLETNLDEAIDNSIGFMLPMDEPGKEVEKRMCLWNGLIATAPGHPFLAAAIERVVNNIRNRFTSVDTDELLCPNPELSIAHKYDTLFTAGPCALGLSINMFLGRHPQTPYIYGDLIINNPNKSKNDGEKEGHDNDDWTSLDMDRWNTIPGRTVILRQDKWDMGAHRFTMVDKNLVVAATDMPDYDDRDRLQGNIHYSKTHAGTGIYGLERLYIDRKSAMEDIHFVVR